MIRRTTSIHVITRQNAILTQLRTISTEVHTYNKPRIFQYLSFYRYMEIHKHNLIPLKQYLRNDWEKLGVLGRIYIAQEGINGQVAVPNECINDFKSSVTNIFGSVEMVMGQQLEMSNKTMVPFHNLDIRMRNQIVRDGLEDGYIDIQDSGDAILPSEWHASLLKHNSIKEGENDTLVLDVRNFYEHDVGRFNGATRIMVETFRDTFHAVDDILSTYSNTHNGQLPKKTMIYCTGGIRCEKVGAYLKQKCGIKKVEKLRGGIANYINFLNEHPKEESLFRGKNFVFDQRCVDTQDEADQIVTNDILGSCFHCGEPTNTHTNCSNLLCHGLVLLCKNCAVQLNGACSIVCKGEMEKMSRMNSDEKRLYRKEQAIRWKTKNPNATNRSVEYHFRIASPQTECNLINKFK